MATLKALNVMISFFLEIAMLLAFGYWGWRTGQSLWLKLALAIGVPLLVIIIWGLFLAPRAGQRANSSVGVAVTVTLFYLAALALMNAGQPLMSVIMMVVAVINRMLVVVWKQW